jgi:tetratricopeptide (TPR) repeat protein
MKNTASFIMIFFLGASVSLNSLSAFGQPIVNLDSINGGDRDFYDAVTLMLSGELDKAIVQFKRAKENYEDQQNYRQVAECHLGLTNCYFFKSEYAVALQYCEQAIALHTREVKNDTEGLEILTITQSLCLAAINHSESVGLKK